MIQLDWRQFDVSDTTYLEQYFSQGHDPRRRRVILHGDLSEQNVSAFIKSLLVLDNTGEQIEIILSTCGGDVYEMFTAYDIIRSLKSYVVGVAIGKVMSAGPLLLAACESRYALPNTWFMFHEFSTGIDDDNPRDAETSLKHTKILQQRWARILGARTKKKYRFWHNLITGTGRDRYRTPEQLRDYGLLDGIKLPDGTIDIGKD
jgi:ATP-dependent protease ClpP protease subunit